MKKLRWLGIAFVSLCAGCALIELPFKLLGSILHMVFGLFQALINVGSSAAMQVAKWTPIAALFTQAGPAESPAADSLRSRPVMEQLAQALEQAPIETISWERARDLQAMAARAGADSDMVFVDPAALLTEEGRRQINKVLEGRQIVSVQWIAGSSR